MIALLLLLILSDDPMLFEVEEDKDLEIILRDMEYLRNNPIDINTASFDELTRIPYLSISDCLKIVEYREKKGPYNSLGDLLNIPGFDIILFDMIKHFIVVKAKPFKIEKFAIRMRAQTEVPKKELSEEYYTKTECSFGPYTIFFITEKDPYENSLFDYYAPGIMIDQGTRKIVLGKYNLDLGSGIMLSPIGSFFYSTDFRIMIKERGIIPYTSVLENSGFFGAAYSDSLFLKYTLFFSNQKLDGRIDSLGFASSFDESGDHTDSISLDRKDNISEKIFGYDIRYQFSDLLISNRTYWCSYNPEFVCSDSFTKFYGGKFWTSGLGLKYSRDFFVMFSEFVRSYKDRIGGLFGFSGYFPYIDFNLVGKYFPVGFYSPKGVEAKDDYIGGTIDIKHRSKIANLGLTLTMDNRTEDDSMKYNLRLNFEKKIGILNAKFQMRWRYLAQTKNLSGSRVFIRMKPVKKIFIDLRLEERYVYSSDGIEKGLFGGLELGTEFKRLKIRMRYGIFNTDSYAARIYVYETDLPGIIHNRMLYNKGNYGFIYVSIKPVDMLKIGLKYSVVNRDTLSLKKLGCQIDVKL